MGRAVTAHATELVPAQDYLSPEYFALRRTSVSASEIAVVLGLSPWRSRFDLWWAKRTGDEQADTTDMRRGRRLEPLVLEDFADAHPEFWLDRVGLCANQARPWQMCTPDALAYEAEPTQEERPEPVAVVEAKTDARSEGWGEQGTDNIPVHYRAQVLWQMDTLGLDAAYVAVWIGYSYREFEVTYDPGDVSVMRQAARDFLDSLEAGEPPELDAHPATGRRLKKLHPDVLDDEAEVEGAWVAIYHDAKADRDLAQRHMDEAEHHIRAAMGNARIGTVNGRKVATRSVYEVAERTQTVRAHTVNRLVIPTPKGA